MTMSTNAITHFSKDFSRFPEAAISLESIYKTIGVLFRACGVDGELQIRLIPATAETDNFFPQAWRTEKSLYMPATIDFLPQPHLNKELALWWSVFAAVDYAIQKQPSSIVSIKPVER